jgi:hypothetical protein
MLVFQIVVLSFAAVCMMSERLVRRARYSLLLGVAAGALFSGSDAALKAIAKHVGAHGGAGLLTPWVIPCVLASVMGFFASARSLQHTDAVAVISLTTVGTTVATFIGGLVVFRDPMASEPPVLALQLAGFVCVCLAAALIPAPVGAAERVAAGEPEHGSIDGGRPPAAAPAQARAAAG